MRITPHIPPLKLANGADPQKLLQNMRPGQPLQATVIGQVKPDITALRIGNLEVQVQTKLKLAAGQRLSLELTQIAEKPALKLLHAAPGPEPKSRLLRQALPNQLPPSRLLEGLRTLEPSLSQTKQLADTLATLRAQLATTATRITPELISTLGKLVSQHKGALSPEVQKAVEKLITKQNAPAQPELHKVAQRALSDATARLTGQAQTQAQPQTPAQLQTSSSSSAMPQAGQPQGAATKSPITQGIAPDIAKQLINLTTAETRPQLQQVLQNLIARLLPGERPLLATQIQRALSESGLFLEARLAKGEPPATNDLKANLLRLLMLLRPLFEKSSAQTPRENTTPDQTNRPATPENLMNRVLGELLRQSEGSLARVQLHQASSLPTEDGARQVWQFEVPIQYKERVDNFLVHLEQEANNKGEKGDSTWRLTLNFDFQPLGPVEARLTLQGEEISSLFQASRAQSAALIEKNLPRLNDAFEKAGLKVGNLHASHAEVIAKAPSPPSPTPILDERA